MNKINVTDARKDMSSFFDSVIHEKPIILKRRKYDPVIVDWMAEIYSYAVEEQDVTFEDAVNAVSPEWLYNHYSPLHETSIQNGWCKAVQCNKSI